MVVGEVMISVLSVVNQVTLLENAAFADGGGAPALGGGAQALVAVEALVMVMVAGRW